MKIMEQFLTNDKLMHALFNTVFNSDKKLNEKAFPSVQNQSFLSAPCNARNGESHNKTVNMVISSEQTVRNAFMSQQRKRRSLFRRGSIRVPDSPKFMIRKGKLFVSSRDGND